MKIDCRKCAHCYVTWDKEHPHGCRAMGFKSYQLSVVVVRQTTPDMECQHYKKKVFDRKK